MSHGHSHGGGSHGHSHGGHGHSHGGGGGGFNAETAKKGMKTFFDKELGWDDDFDDDPALDKQVRGRKSVSEEGNLDPNQEFELLCAHGAIAAVMVQWAGGVQVDRRQVFQGVDATPIMWASLRGHLPVVKFLHMHGANVNYQMPDGQSCLMWAATESRLEVGNFLLENGADANQVDERNYTAAAIAVQNDDLPFLHMINNKSKIDPAQLDFEEHTLLIWAAYRGQLSMVEYCYEIIGCDIKHIDKTKRNALHWAAREGHAEVCAYLIKNGLNPSDKDIEGRDTIEWALARNHKEAAEVLKSKKTQVDNRCTGTISRMATDRPFLILSITGVAVPILGFILMLWFPPLFSHWIVGLFLAKNMALRFFYPRPENSRKVQGGMMAEVAVPKNISQALRGLGLTRLRDPMNLFGLLTFFIVQHMAFNLASVPFPTLYWVFLPLCLICIFFTKHSAYNQIIARGSLKDSPILKCIERKEWAMLHERIYDVSRHVRLPLRAYYSQEIDSNVRRYDSWSLFLDAPIGETNHRFFFLFLVFGALLQTTVFISSWFHFQTKVCPANHNEHGFSLCSTLYAMVFHGLPCADIHPDNANLSWIQWFFPSTNNSAGVWLIHFGFLCALSFIIVVSRQYSSISHGVTRQELKNPVAPTTNGTLVSIVRGNSNIYSEGGPTTNMVLFLLGKQGDRWKDLYAVPAPPTS